MGKIELFLILLLSTFLLGGCSLIIPEDDLNGNNKEVSPINKINVKEDYLNNNKPVQDNSGIAQLEQAIDQASYELQLRETTEKKEIAPVISENTDIEKDLLTYSNKYTKAIIKTNFGDIKVNFYMSEAPLAVGNFIKLAENNFYDKTKFHRVISGFMIQGGDPNSKDDRWEDDGKGGPNYAFRDEIGSHKLTRGSLAMANSGKDTNSSQFFILTALAQPDLDGKHTVFGEVIEGMDTVDKIEKVTVSHESDHADHPIEDVVIENVELEK